MAKGLYLPAHALRPQPQYLTDYLDPNEVCMGLWQGPVGDRWIQKVWVVRGDTIARYQTDIGPVSDYPHIPIEILPGDDETTVAEFLDEAERHRHDNFAHNHLVRVASESTLIADINRQREARRLYIKGQTVSGPYFSISRSIYNRSAMRRKVLDSRTKRTSTKDGMH